MTTIPFFINSNICLTKSDICTFDRFMNSIAGNTGNSYITYSLIKEILTDKQKLHHIQNIYNYNFKEKQQEDIDCINNICSHCFLILQDQIRLAESYNLQLPYKNIENFISKLNKPIIVAGIGANCFDGFDKDFHKKLKPELKYFLKFISDHCIEIGVRGYFTQELLHNIGIDNTRVIGCPSFYECGPDRIVKKQSFSQQEILLSSNLDNVQLKCNDTVCQDFQEENIIRQISYNQNTLKYFSNESIIYNKLSNNKYHVFSDIDSWKSYVKNFKISIGARVHGSILAINSGIPAICTNTDSRSAEMCELLGIPRITNINRHSDLVEICNNIDITTLNSKYPNLYNNYKDFLKVNNINLQENNNFPLEQPTLKSYNCHICNKIIKPHKKIPFDYYLDFKTSSEIYKKQIKILYEELKDKKVIIYGAGKCFEILNKKYKLTSNLNITAIFDNKFLYYVKGDFAGIKALPPYEIINETFDYILVTNEKYEPIIKYLKETLLISEGKVKAIFEETINDERNNLNYLNKHHFEKTLPKLIKKLKNKKVMLYGTDIFAQLILTYFDLSELNIIGVSDKKYSDFSGEKEFFGLKTYSPNDIAKAKPDYILVTTKVAKPIIKDLKLNYINKTNIKIIPIIK